MPNRPVRIPLMTRAEWTPEIRDYITAHLGPETPEKSWTAHTALTFGRHPKLMGAAVQFSRRVQASAEISPRLREIVIMRVAWHYQADYEWGHHNRIMRDLGMGDEHIQGLKAGPDAAIWSDEERAVLQVVDELTISRELSDEIWKALSQHFSVRQILDVIFMTGQYAMMACAFNAVGLELEAEYKDYALESC